MLTGVGQNKTQSRCWKILRISSKKKHKNRYIDVSCRKSFVYWSYNIMKTLWTSTRRCLAQAGWLEAKTVSSYRCSLILICRGVRLGKLNGLRCMQFKRDDSFSNVSKGNKHKAVTEFEYRTMGSSLDMVYWLALFIIFGNKGSVIWNAIRQISKVFASLIAEA